jgi:arylsulfate sulfotransferase
LLGGSELFPTLRTIDGQWLDTRRFSLIRPGVNAFIIPSPLNTLRQIKRTFGVASFALTIACPSATAQVTRVENPLVASYSVAAPAGSHVAVEFGPGANYGFSTSAITVPSGESSVSILVAGMKEHSTYHMRAVITHADGTKEFDADHTFQTGDIPTGRTPAIVVTSRAGVNASPGIELASLNPPQDNLGNPLRIVALNPAGDLIWYYDFDEPFLAIAQPIKLLPNGHFLMVLFNGTTGPGGEVREIDLAGRTIHDFTVDELNQWLAAAGYRWTAHAIHHDILPLANGHTIVLVNTEKRFSNGPHRHTTLVLGDALIDLDPNYKPVWTWTSFDHLDVYRHPMEFPDWTHTNAVIYSPDDGNLLLSLRHQHWVVKIDYGNGRGSGNVLWRLGYQGDFKLLNSNSPADWFFAQHYLQFITPNTTGDFQLALFDNGNHRVLDPRGSTCDPSRTLSGYARPAIWSKRPDCYSRSTIFELNETARTARLLWSDGAPFSNWGGVTMQLPNKNIFFDIARLPDTILRPIDNPRHPALDELAILIFVLVIFLCPLPSAVIPFLPIPIALILAFAPILGGIAVTIGMMIDAAVVVFFRPEAKAIVNEPHVSSASENSAEAFSALNRIARPSFFVIAIVALSFLSAFTPLDDPIAARILEVTPQNPPQIVWEMNVNGQESYRTIHLPSLYPGVNW